MASGIGLVALLIAEGPLRHHAMLNAGDLVELVFAAALLVVSGMALGIGLMAHRGRLKD